MQKVKIKLDKQREIVYNNRAIFRIEEELIKRNLGSSIAEYLTPFGEKDPDVAEIKAGLKLMSITPLAIFIWGGQEDLEFMEVVDNIPVSIQEKEEISGKIIPAIMSACGFEAEAEPEKKSKGKGK